MSDLSYSFFDRLLHRLALGSALIAEVWFDADQAMVRKNPSSIVNRRHVFVSGLARSGTTVLMQRFHSTGHYRSLTYRDMPFVLAPNLWRRLSRHSPRELEPAERAHGDNIRVDADSPESLDEVFWRVFAGNRYIGADRLEPHMPPPDLIEKYVRYINAILTAQGSPRLDRYLSKNNNNILRLKAILCAFPNALILIPFRNPMQHSYSLLRQHLHFSQMQMERDFTLSYMNWLGHHEFGLGHRPFTFEVNADSAYPATTLNYWLHQWCQVYSWLERAKPKQALFVAYEDLCDDPMTWSRIAQLAGIPEDSTVGAASLQSRERSIDTMFDAHLSECAMAIYVRLVADSRRDLSGKM